MKKNYLKVIAFMLHEEWRKTKLQPDGTYCSRWKVVKDKNFIKKLNKNDLPNYIRFNDGVFEMDISNVSYNLLSPDWQHENDASAKVIASLMPNCDKLTQEQIGETVHSAWLKRNKWAKGSNLDVHFKDLPKSEQLKDLLM